jgi:MarR family transcriptional regulator, lower aerobic nicotinate degradation pathway regulator
LAIADDLTDTLIDFNVEDHVGFLLRRAHQRHVALRTVQAGRTTQNLLGRLAAMDPATIQGVVQRLIARGLIERGRDPMDRRTAVLEPTEAGIALITRLVDCARKVHEAALAPLSAQERDQLLALLRKMG